MSEMIFPVFGRTPDPIGYFAIDSTINGSCSGVRMMPELSSAEVTQFAHLITPESGFTGLPVGGAKAGIIGDPKMPAGQKRERLAEFGRGLKCC